MLSLCRCRRVHSEGAVFFLFLRAYCHSTDAHHVTHHVTLSYQMLGMLGARRYPAYVLLDRLIIFIIIHILRYHSPLRDSLGRASGYSGRRPGIHGQLGYTAFSTYSTRYISYLRGLHVVEPLPPKLGGGPSKIRGR